MSTIIENLGKTFETLFVEYANSKKKVVDVTKEEYKTFDNNIRKWQIIANVSKLGDIDQEKVDSFGVYLLSLDLVDNSRDKIMYYFNAIMKNQNVFYDIDKFIYRKKTDKIIGYKATSFEDVSIIYGFIIKPSKVKNIQFHRLFFLLALTTGARRAEILNIKWKNIDLKEGLILIEQSKNGKPRYVPIINEIVEIIKRVKENCLNYEYLFTNSKGHHFTKYFVNNFFEVIEKATGIHTSTHELRKYFATLLSLLSVEIQDVSKYLGHSSISQTLKYINPTNQQIAQKEKSQMEIIFPFIKTNTLTENMQEIKALLSIKSNKITHLEEVLRL